MIDDGPGVGLGGVGGRPDRGRRRRDRADRPAGPGSLTARQAAGWIAVYVSLAAACGLGIGLTAGWVTAGQFYAGYLTEYSLSLDNLFVFAVIMTWFAVPPARQHRVLLLGIGLALAMRSAVIVAGAAALNRFGWLFYPLGGILLWTAAGLIAGARARPERQAERHTRLTAWLRRRQPWARGHAGPDGHAGPRGPRGHGARVDAAAGRGDRGGRPAVRLRLDPGRFRHHHQRRPGRGLQHLRPDGPAPAVRAGGRPAEPDRLPERRPRRDLRLHRREAAAAGGARSRGARP